MENVICKNLKVDWEIGGADVPYAVVEEHQPLRGNGRLVPWPHSQKYSMGFKSEDALLDIDFLVHALPYFYGGLNQASTGGAIIVSCAGEEILARDGLVSFMIWQHVEGLKPSNLAKPIWVIEAGDDDAQIIVKPDLESGTVAIELSPERDKTVTVSLNQWIEESVKAAQSFVRFLDDVAHHPDALPEHRETADRLSKAMCLSLAEIG